MTRRPDDPITCFTPKELRKLRSLKDPHGIQKFLDAMPYHLADTAWSPRVVLRENTSHCFEGAMLAAAALRANGYPPLVFDLEAEHDTDHVVTALDLDEREARRIGTAARERTFAEHTSARRAAELVAALEQARHPVRTAHAMEV